MLLGVLADSHDHLDRLKAAVQRFSERKVQAVLHAGDFVAPFTIPVLGAAGVRVHGVFGNNDGERVGLWRRFQDIGELHERPFELTLGDHRILMQHEPVALDALSGYDLVVYGHTHEVDVRRPDQGPLVVNPGEVCGWVTGRATAALVDLATRDVELLELN